MRERGGISNNDRYHAPKDQGKALEKALAQIEKHTQAPSIVKEWGQNIEAKREQQRAAEAARQKAKAAEQAKAKQPAAKVKTVEKSEGITFSR